MNITEEEFCNSFSSQPDFNDDELYEAKVKLWLDNHDDFVASYFSRKAAGKLLKLRTRTHSNKSVVPRIVSISDDGHATDVLTPLAPWMQAPYGSSPPGRKISGVDASIFSSSCCSSPERKISDFETPSSSFDPSSYAYSPPAIRKISNFERRPPHSAWPKCDTPTRKISTMSTPDFGRDMQRIISDVDGGPTFVRDTKYVSRRSSRLVRRSTVELRKLKNLDESALLIELVHDIANDLDITNLCHKILQNVSILTNADRCSLFLVQKFTEGHRVLVSKVHDVKADSTIEDICANNEIEVPWGSGILGYVAQSGETVNIADAYADERFNWQVDQQTGYQTKSLLCMPLHSGLDEYGNAEVVGVAQFLNKNGRENNDAVHTFTKEDEGIVEKYLTFCGIGIANAQLFEQLEMELKRNEVLLELARVIFEDQSTLKNIVHKVMQCIQSLVECERYSLLLVDPTTKGSFSQVFDMEARDLFTCSDSCAGVNHTCGTPDVSFEVNKGITEYVATTGETLNIPNAYEDPRFDPSVDDGSMFQTRTILCMPVRNSNRDIIGVAQLLNKTNGQPFNTNDEHLFEAFAIFCGMAINNTSMYEDCVKAWARQKIAIDVLSYHATASTDDALKLMDETLPTSESLRLREFSFDDAELSDHETVLSTLRMFADLNLIDRFRMDYRKLCTWVLTVKKNYRNVVYHNWRHAFNVAQCMFLMLKEDVELETTFSDEEKCALLIACLCHDIDHRGLTNTFQVQTASPLAQLYGTSVMERHHLDHCIMILNSSGNDILNSLSPNEYNLVVTVIEQAILATDLANYFKSRGEYFRLVESKTFQWSDNNQRTLLRSMLMTASDLSAIGKPWHVQYRVAQLIAEEFCQQGDLEQRELHVTPIELMDRAKHDKFPTMQVGYVDNICLPIYEHLSDHFADFKPMLTYCNENRQHWQELADARVRGETTATPDIDREDDDNA